MFKNWSGLFTTECRVILLKDACALYPIFKNGQTSLFNYAKEKKLKILKNKEINKVKKIKIFLRDPVERFVSGVHTVIELEGISDIDVFLRSVEGMKTYNRHFVPQFYWLMHLFKYYRGVIELLPINELYNLIPNRDGPCVSPLTSLRKKTILSINNKNYINVDLLLIKKYIGKTAEITNVIKEFKNAVS